MSVAVSCNLPEGDILGVDSALTVSSQVDGKDLVKVYENAEKLFAFRDLPVGIAANGAASIGARSIGSYLQEFITSRATPARKAGVHLADVVEALRRFLSGQYEVSNPVPARAAAPWLYPWRDTRPPLGTDLARVARERGCCSTREVRPWSELERRSRDVS
jgi:hypothetical protein